MINSASPNYKYNELQPESWWIFIYLFNGLSIWSFIISANEFVFVNRKIKKKVKDKQAGQIRVVHLQTHNHQSKTFFERCFEAQNIFPHSGLHNALRMYIYFIIRGCTCRISSAFMCLSWNMLLLPLRQLNWLFLFTFPMYHKCL